MGQHAPVLPPGRAALALLVLASLFGACSDAGFDFDEAAMVDPGTSQVTADPGQLRVLRYHDDPTAGDDWTTVLAPEPAVMTATGAFREAASRTADDDEPADVRLLYEAVAPGRTLLVQVNCRGCDDRVGVPETDVEDTGIHVWDLLVGEGGELLLSGAAATAGEEHETTLGEHVVVVREPDALRELGPLDEEVLVHVARHVPDAGANLLVDVFAAVGEGGATITYGNGQGDEYPVLVVGDR